MRASTSIHVDEGVFQRLLADGITWLECLIKDSGHVYRAHIDTMCEHGQLQQRFGLQRVLHLKYWSVNGEPAEALKQVTPSPQPQPIQPVLFDLADLAHGGY